MIRAVIGAQYGDEGKGLVTDYLSRPETLVVRYNGGAQAGHTVVTPEGRTHEFHHVGSGTFRGAATLLSRYFLVNPVLFREEAALLAETIDTTPRRILVDRNASVSTPWDMMLNAAIEAKRGHQRHGSCGVGINETVERVQAGCGIVYAAHLQETRERLHGLLLSLRNGYVKRRADYLGVTLPDEAWSHELLDRFIDDCHDVADSTDIRDGRTVLAHAQDVLFEGAQGLRLDEYAPGFPHVTRSRTGTTNILRLLGDAKRFTEPIEAYYVTRCYTTRHGAGPLDGELPGHPWGWDGPETNDENEHQGKLRYARLDAVRVGRVIAEDRTHDSQRIDARLVVTCLDQCHGEVDAVAVATAAKLPLGLVSYGPTRHDVKEE